MEGFSPNYSDEMAKTARDYARQQGLLLTGGGDGHGTWASQVKYAIGILEVDAAILNKGCYVLSNQDCCECPLDTVIDLSFE